MREKAYELMQFPDNAYEEPQVHFISSKQRDGYRVEKYEISPEPELWVPFLVLIPDSATAESKAPGVLCFPGWDTPKEVLCGEDFTDLTYESTPYACAFPFSNAMALNYVRRGIVALASDNAGTGEQLGVYDRQQFALKMMFKGRNYAGLSVLYRWAMPNGWLGRTMWTIPASAWPDTPSGPRPPCSWHYWSPASRRSPTTTL